MVELIFMSYALFGLGYAIAYWQHYGKNIWVFIVCFLTWPAAIGYTFGVATLEVEDDTEGERDA